MSLIQELIEALEAALKKSANDVGRDPLERAMQMQAYCIDSAGAIDLIGRVEAKLHVKEKEAYFSAKDKLLMWLVYTDKLVRFLDPVERKIEIDVADHFGAANYFDWRLAESKAVQLFGLFLKNQENLLPELNEIDV